MEYMKARQISQILRIHYQFLWKYLNKEMSVEQKEKIHKYSSHFNFDEFIKIHTYPNSRNLDIDKVKEHGVWTLKEVHKKLIQIGILIHPTTLWRWTKDGKLTSIKIKSTYRLPIYLVIEEIYQFIKE